MKLKFSAVATAVGHRCFEGGRAPLSGGRSKLFFTNPGSEHTVGKHFKSTFPHSKAKTIVSPSPEIFFSHTWAARTSSNLLHHIKVVLRVLPITESIVIVTPVYSNMRLIPPVFSYSNASESFQRVYAL